MSNFEEDLKNFIFYLSSGSHLGIKYSQKEYPMDHLPEGGSEAIRGYSDNNLSFEDFVKEKLKNFLILKKIEKRIFDDNFVSECKFCENCLECKSYGFPCIKCSQICYNQKLSEGYPLHIN